MLPVTPLFTVKVLVVIEDEFIASLNLAESTMLVVVQCTPGHDWPWSTWATHAPT